MKEFIYNFDREPKVICSYHDTCTEECDHSVPHKFRYDDKFPDSFCNNINCALGYGIEKECIPISKNNPRDMIKVPPPIMYKKRKRIPVEGDNETN